MSENDEFLLWVMSENRASWLCCRLKQNKLTSPAWGDEFRQRLEFIAFQAGYLFLWSIQIYLEFGYFALVHYLKQSLASGYFATLSMTIYKSMTRILSFWAFARKRKIHRNLRHTLYILELCVKFTWIFISKMLFFRGLPRRFCKNGSQWRFVLSFWALAKNPRLKYANSHFKFMDTSLRSV